MKNIFRISLLMLTAIFSMQASVLFAAISDAQKESETLCIEGHETSITYGQRTMCKFDNLGDEDSIRFKADPSIDKYVHLSVYSSVSNTSYNIEAFYDDGINVTNLKDMPEYQGYLTSSRTPTLSFLPNIVGGTNGKLWRAIPIEIQGDYIIRFTSTTSDTKHPYTVQLDGSSSTMNDDYLINNLEAPNNILFPYDRDYFKLYVFQNDSINVKVRSDISPSSLITRIIDKDGNIISSTGGQSQFSATYSSNTTLVETYHISNTETDGFAEYYIEITSTEEQPYTVEVSCESGSSNGCPNPPEPPVSSDFTAGMQYCLNDVENCALELEQENPCQPTPPTGILFDDFESGLNEWTGDVSFDIADNGSVGAMSFVSAGTWDYAQKQISESDLDKLTPNTTYTVTAEVTNLDNVDRKIKAQIQYKPDNIYIYKYATGSYFNLPANQTTPVTINITMPGTFTTVSKAMLKLLSDSNGLNVRIDNIELK